MDPFWRFALFVAAAASSASALAAGELSCDCGEIVGRCEASIRVEPTGQPGSYGANFTLTSSAPRCSRVDYYVDNTPYFNIITRGNTTADSVFGTSPINRSNFTNLQCRVCKVIEVDGSKPESSGGPGAASDDPAAVFSGTWRGGEKNPFGEANPVTVSIKVSPGSVTGSWATQGQSPTPLVNPVLDGQILRFGIFNGMFNTSVTMTLTSATTADFRGFAFPFSFSGSLRKQ